MSSPSQGFAQRFLQGYTGPVASQETGVLAEAFGDVTRDTEWATAGFKRVSLPGGKASLGRAARGIQTYLCRRAAALGLDFPLGSSLDTYHRIAGLDDDKHLHLAKWGVPFSVFGIDADEICDFVGEHLKRKVELFFLHDDPAVPDMCGVRIIRPCQHDHNPFHRDGWFATLRRAVTLWVPVSGCSAGSSLRVFRGSHLWPESDLLRTPEGARFGRKKYKVPALLALRRDVQPIEPVTEQGRALLFSSFLLHGGGANTQPDTTRVSFELRFVVEGADG